MVYGESKEDFFRTDEFHAFSMDMEFRLGVCNRVVREF